MTEPLDVVAAVEKAKSIVNDMHPDQKACIVELAGQMLVAAEIRRLTSAVKNAGNILREELEQL